MRLHTLALGLIAVVNALPYADSRDCRLVDIPVEINVPRYIINATINDNWDVAALTFNLTRRNVGSAADPIPISGMTSEPIASTYIIGATLCGTGGPTLVLTHGIIESKLLVQLSKVRTNATVDMLAGIGTQHSQAPISIASSTPLLLEGILFSIMTGSVSVRLRSK